MPTDRARPVSELRLKSCWINIFSDPVGLLITDKAASPVRVTFDVDLVASVAALAAYHGMEKELARLGFKRDLAPDAPICRWRYRELEVDLMPADPNILGFSNRWYPLALTSAIDGIRLR